MIKSIFILLSVSFTLTLHAQEPEVCKQALVQYEAGQFQEALKLYGSCINHDPGYGVPYYNRGKTRYELQDIPGALADFEKAIMLSPEFVQSYYALAEHYLTLDKREEALNWINRAISLNPNLSAAYNLRGWIHFNFKNYSQAHQDFTEAIRLDPSNATAYNNRASARFENQDIAAATEKELLETKADYEKALLLNNNLPNAHRNLGYIELLLGNKELASILLGEAKRRSAKDPMVYLYQGKLSLADSNWQAAIGQFDEAIFKYNRLAEAYLDKGKALYELRRYDDALYHFGKALEISDKLQGEGHYWRAKTYAKQFERELMLEELNQTTQAGYFDKLLNRSVFVREPVFSYFDSYKPFKKFMKEFRQQ